MTMTNDITDEIKLLSKTDKVICIKKMFLLEVFMVKYGGQ